MNTSENADAGLTQMNTNENADAELSCSGIPAFAHNVIYFSTTSSTDVRMFSFPESTSRV
jgi:hypothetical protein